MRFFDRVLQRWRMRQALRHLEGCHRIVDVGAERGELFRMLGSRLAEGFGIEARLADPIREPNHVVLPGLFPNVRPERDGWDAITMLAVLEHIPDLELQSLADACYALLRDEGRVVITVPAPAVDRILVVLKSTHLVDAVSLEEHHGFVPQSTPAIFCPPRFRLLAHRRFQLGLNHIFVFEKCSSGPRRP